MFVFFDKYKQLIILFVSSLMFFLSVEATYSYQINFLNQKHSVSIEDAQNESHERNRVINSIDNNINNVRVKFNTLTQTIAQDEYELSRLNDTQDTLDVCGRFSGECVSHIKGQLEELNQLNPYSENWIYRTIYVSNTIITLLNNIPHDHEIFNFIAWQEIDDDLMRSIALALQLYESDQSASSSLILKSWFKGYRGYLYESWYRWQLRKDDSLGLSSTNQSVENLRLAEKFTKDALKIAESIRENYPIYKWSWQLGRLYHLKGDQEKALTSYQVAFETIESIREKIRSSTTEGDELRDRQFDFRDRVEPLYREYVGLLMRVEESSVPLSNIKKSREIISALQLGELENFLECNFFESDLVSLDEAINESSYGEQVAAALYPLILEDRIELILKLPDFPKNNVLSEVSSIQRFNTVVSRQVLEEKLDLLRLSLERPYFSDEGQEAASQLYDWLIEPVESLLVERNIKVLTFVLDGKLRNIPMSVLFDSRTNQYLIQKYAVSISPNFKISNLNSKKFESLLIAGLTKTLKVADQDAPVNEQKNQYGTLDYADIEVQGIESAIADPEKITTRTGNKFTEEELSNLDLKSFDIVHILTHSQFGQNRKETFILDKDGNRIDLDKLDKLFSNKKEELIDLLVLSSCETAEGDDREVLGIAGVAASGAKSVIATLWSVDDSSTATLMNKFYENLFDKQLPVAIALQKAQKDLLDEPSVYKPFHWSPFILVGNWD